MAGSEPQRRVLRLEPLDGFDPEIGRWLAALEEVRQGTLESVRDLPQSALDWKDPDGGGNSIGTLLYHIALVEMRWLYLDILEQEIPELVQARFPIAMGTHEQGLTSVERIPLAEHVARLAWSRAILLEALRTMTPESWRLPRTPADADYQVTPEWAILHLIEHEAGHGFQIRAMRRRAEQASAH